jgi:DNA polymerase III alpha subunit
MSAYVELHCHSNFSLLDGASHPEELAARAAEIGMPALALTDHNAVYGAARFLRAARENHIQPVPGAELTLCDDDNPTDTHHLTLLLENQAGWRNKLEDYEHDNEGRTLLPCSSNISVVNL